MMPMKINIAKSISEKHKDLYIQRHKNVLDVFLRAGWDSKLEGKDIGKAKSVGFRVYD